MGQILQFFRSDDPRIDPAPFDDGTVQIVALDTQGSGNAIVKAAPGTFEGGAHPGRGGARTLGDEDALSA